MKSPQEGSRPRREKEKQAVGLSNTDMLEMWGAAANTADWSGRTSEAHEKPSDRDVPGSRRENVRKVGIKVPMQLISCIERLRVNYGTLATTPWASLVERHMQRRIAQLCLILCDPMDYTIHGILQARILEWVAFPFSRGSSQPKDQTQISCIAVGFFTSWATKKAQEHWSGQPIPSPADLPDPGIELESPSL